VVLMGAAAGLAVELGTRRRRAMSSAVRDPPADPSRGPTTLHSVVLLAVGASAAGAPAPRGGGPGVGGGGGSFATRRRGVRGGVLYFRTGLGAYGGGLAILPHLSERLDALDWLTRRQVADAVSVVLLTPGPVLRVATFAGYVHHGAAGAAAATLALFAAPWVVGRLAGGWLGRGRNHPVATAAGPGLPSAGGGAVGPAGVVPGSHLHRAP